MSGKGKSKSNGKGKGKGKGLKPCPRGKDCPFINEHQHIWEYSHDNPGESKEAKVTFPGAGNKVGGFIGKAHKLGGTGPGGGIKLGGSASGGKLLSASVAKLGAPPSSPAPRIPSDKTLSPPKSALPVKRPGDIASKKAVVVVDLTLDESPPAPKKSRA